MMKSDFESAYRIFEEYHTKKACLSNSDHITVDSGYKDRNMGQFYHLCGTKDVIRTLRLYKNGVFLAVFISGVHCIQSTQY